MKVNKRQRRIEERCVFLDDARKMNGLKVCILVLSGFDGEMFLTLLVGIKESRLKKMKHQLTCRIVATILKTSTSVAHASVSEGWLLERINFKAICMQVLFIIGTLGHSRRQLCFRLRSYCEVMGWQTRVR